MISKILNSTSLFRHARALNSTHNAAEIETKLASDYNWEIHDKSGLHFTVVDSPGVLKRVLKVFFDNNIDLTAIRSKPSPFIDCDRKTEFYVDFKGVIKDPKSQKTIRDLR
jgi:prephenate dehydratase